MTTQFEFAKAFWFRWPLRALVVAVTAFALLALYPAFVSGPPHDSERAAFGFTVCAAFVVLATMVSVAIDESSIDFEDGAVRLRFEAFFHAALPYEDIVAVRRIEPLPRWRYRWGLSTDWIDRIACSHGGRLIEIELVRPWEARLWPRRVAATRFWLGVTQPDAFIEALRHAAPHAFRRDRATAA